MLNALKLSSPDVGSSKSINDGSVTNSTPIAVLFFSPPEMVLDRTEPILVSAASLRFNSSISSSTRLVYASLDMPLSFNLAAKASASLGVKTFNRTSSCMT